MHDRLKQEWVCSLLIDRMKYVVKGDAEIYFTYFESSVHKMIHIKNREDVLSFWKRTYNPRPAYGGTDVGQVVRDIKDKIESGDFYGFGDLREEKPEILIINDGADNPQTKSFPYKVNTIALLAFREELKKLCLATHGKYIYVNSKDELEEYE